MHGDRGLIPKPAQYLLRFDDLCPTVAHSRWQRVLPLIAEFGLHPILAVIPDNCDCDLQLSPPDPEFWDQMRALEAAGATIALHGYRHLCESRGRSLLALHRRSEFAGVSEETQLMWIRSGLKILCGHGLNPRIWVAPRHGFDKCTLRALRKEGIDLLSDGLARIPFTRDGITWIPQQLWAPVEKSKGLWTICLHSNSIHQRQVTQLRSFLLKHAAQFTSLDCVLDEFRPARLGPIEKIHEVLALWRIQVSHARKRRSYHSQHTRTN